VDLLLVELSEGFDHHLAARGLPLVILLKEDGADQTHDGDFVREERWFGRPEQVPGVFYVGFCLDYAAATSGVSGLKQV